MTENRQARQAAENREHLHRLLNERRPEFLAALRLAARRVEFELSCARTTDDQHYGAVSP
jgi:hypothetical protein